MTFRGPSSKDSISSVTRTALLWQGKFLLLPCRLRACVRAWAIGLLLSCGSDAMASSTVAAAPSSASVGATLPRATAIERIVALFRSLLAEYTTEDKVVPLLLSLKGQQRTSLKGADLVSKTVVLCREFVLSPFGKRHNIPLAGLEERLACLLNKKRFPVTALQNVLGLHSLIALSGQKKAPLAAGIAKHCVGQWSAAQSSCVACGPRQSAGSLPSQRKHHQSLTALAPMPPQQGKQQEEATPRTATVQHSGTSPADEAALPIPTATAMPISMAFAQPLPTRQPSPPSPPSPKQPPQQSSSLPPPMLPPAVHGAQPNRNGVEDESSDEEGPPPAATTEEESSSGSSSCDSDDEGVDGDGQGGEYVDECEDEGSECEDEGSEQDAMQMDAVEQPCDGAAAPLEHVVRPPEPRMPLTQYASSGAPAEPAVISAARRVDGGRSSVSSNTNIRSSSSTSCSNDCGDGRGSARSEAYIPSPASRSRWAEESVDEVSALVLKLLACPPRLLNCAHGAGSSGSSGSSGSGSKGHPAPRLQRLPARFGGLTQYKTLLSCCVCAETYATIHEAFMHNQHGHGRGGDGSILAAPAWLLSVKGSAMQGSEALLDVQLSLLGGGSSAAELPRVADVVHLALHQHRKPSAGGADTAGDAAWREGGCLALVVHCSSQCRQLGIRVQLSVSAMEASLSPSGSECVVRMRSLGSIKPQMRQHAALEALAALGRPGSPTFVQQRWLLRWLLRTSTSPQPPQPPQPLFPPPATTTQLPPLLRAAVARKFNAPQQAALLACMQSAEGIELLQGPPGTGKTTTIVGLISGLLSLPPPKPRARGALAVAPPRPGATTLPSLTPAATTHPERPHRRLLICAPSNAAVDEVVARLLRDGVLDGRGEPLQVDGPVRDPFACARVVRVGDMDSMATASLAVALDTIADARRAAYGRECGGGGRGRGGGKGGSGRGSGKGAPTGERARLAGQLGGGSMEGVRQRLLREAEIVCATLSGAGMELMLDFSAEHLHSKDGSVPAFDALIVDEATQATEPELLIGLRHAAPLVILVGDEMQLPPTVISEAARHARLGVSAFERLVVAGVRKHQLTHQYRMHPCLSSFPSRHFYGDSLVDSVAAEQRPTPAGFPWPDHSNPLCVLAVSEGVEERPRRGKRKRREALTGVDGELGEPMTHRSYGGHSWTNVAEAEAVVASVHRLLGAAPIGQCVPASSIGVITFYKAQAELIRRKLHDCTDADCSLVECSTVDSFQGREKELIIISCVRAQGDRRTGGASKSAGGANLGFLRDGRRLNVALTRAKRGLIVVCHPPTLRNGANRGGSGGGDSGCKPTVDGTLCLANLLREAEERRLILDARQLSSAHLVSQGDESPGEEID
jgi:hypothetical protein